MATSQPHPLQSLSIAETTIARDVILQSHPEIVVVFRIITLQEPAKADLIKFLELEHTSKLTSGSPRPPRLAKAHFDVVEKQRISKYFETIVDIDKRSIVAQEEVTDDVHASLTVYAASSTLSTTCAHEKQA